MNDFNKFPAVELTIDEVKTLIDYHRELHQSIPVENYHKKNANGVTMREVALKHQSRQQDLTVILNEWWPK